MKAKPLSDDSGEVRELTAADMNRMIPFAEMHPELSGLLPPAGGGEVASAGSSERQSVHLRLDPEIIDHFKATGPGWQGRINDVLKSVIRREN